MREEYNLRQEKMDEMRQDMLIEQKLRADEEYFHTHLEDKFGEELEDLVAKISNECEFYDRDGDAWIAFLLEK